MYVFICDVAVSTFLGPLPFAILDKACCVQACEETVQRPNSRLAYISPCVCVCVHKPVCVCAYTAVSGCLDGGAWCTNDEA